MSCYVTIEECKRNRGHEFQNGAPQANLNQNEDYHRLKPEREEIIRDEYIECFLK